MRSSTKKYSISINFQMERMSVFIVTGNSSLQEPSSLPKQLKTKQKRENNKFYNQLYYKNVPLF